VDHHVKVKNVLALNSKPTWIIAGGENELLEKKDWFFF